MYPDLPQPISHQPQLLVLEGSIGTVELFPTVWKALEDLTKHDEVVRSNAVEQIAAMNAARISPVVSYFMVTRIVEPNLIIRSRVVEILSSVLTIDEEGYPAPEDVRNSLRLYLAAIRTRQIYALLQVSAEYNELESCVALLLSASSFGGNHLVSILEERKNPNEIRKQAAIMISEVGYIYTLPVLEKIAGRLEANLAGQKAMDFISQKKSTEVELLPYVEEAISALKSQ